MLDIDSMRRAILLMLLALGLAAGPAAGPAAGIDRPLQGDLLRLRDPAHQGGRRLLFRAVKEAAIGRDLGDPRLAGATLEVTGTVDGDGTSGAIVLPAGRWTALGSPPGSKGYRYSDRGGAVRRVLLRRGTLVALARGAAWPYVIDGPQGPIDVRLTVGADVYCARFTRYDANQAGRVVARNAAAPASCNVIPSTCRNGVVEGSEECDDGNPANGDGCTAACTLDGVAGLCAGITTASGTTLRAVPIPGTFDQPVHVAAPPLDPRHLFVVEQPGRIRVVEDGTLLTRPFLAIEDRVSCCNERGLLSVAFHPRYRSNGRFFVYYTDNNGDLVIARYQVTADRTLADQASERILLTIPHRPFGNHNGGQLAFGPDGYLYVGTGDGGGGGDPQENAQDGSVLLGKLLRLDVEVDDRPYHEVPPTNPFVGAGAPRDEIWALGLRNPWRFTFDRANGDLYIGDVGQGAWEEVDVQPGTSPGGENYGWDVFEGNHCFEPAPALSCPVPPTGFTMPVLEYDHDTGCSMTGGFVYRGCRMPDLHGTYFYSDYCTPFFRTFRGVSGGIAQQQGDRTSQLTPVGALIEHVVSFGEDARGELYFAEIGGTVYKVEPAP